MAKELGHKDRKIKQLEKKIKELEKSRDIEPSEKNANKFYHNSWDKLQDVGQAVADTVNLAVKQEWSWIRNWNCKYVSIRIDMRSGHCVLVDKDGSRISIEQLKYQYNGEDNEQES